MHSIHLFLITASLLLTHALFAQEPPAHRPPGPPPGAPPGGEMSGPQQTKEEEIKEYLTLDKNGDGNLSKDEITDRFQSLITRADSNGDGVISSEELAQMVSRRFAAKAKRGNERGGPGGPPPGGMRPRAHGGGEPEPIPPAP
ncbi:MAG: hypothetical protein ABIS50_06915 [Luteolibacter sp.]|uniref:hypothetical protein n=1 Tax=Luteolibacter sp. TaxID=1962973 RepID=UPI00326580B3